MASSALRRSLGLLTILRGVVRNFRSAFRFELSGPILLVAFPPLLVYRQVARSIHFDGPTQTAAAALWSVVPTWIRSWFLGQSNAGHHVHDRYRCDD